MRRLVDACERRDMHRAHAHAPHTPGAKLDRTDQTSRAGDICGGGTSPEERARGDFGLCTTKGLTAVEAITETARRRGCPRWRWMEQARCATTVLECVRFLDSRGHERGYGWKVERETPDFNLVQGRPLPGIVKDQTATLNVSRRDCRFASSAGSRHLDGHGPDR